MDTDVVSEKKVTATAVVDFFINAGLHRNPDLLSRARFLVLVLTAGISVFCLMLVSLYFLPPTGSVDLVLSITLGNGATACYVLYRLKRHGSYSLCGVLVVMQCWVGIVGSTVITGGPYVSSVAQLFSIPCVMAFFLGGKYWGVVTAFLSLATVGFLSVMQSMGFQFPQIASAVAFPFAQSFLLPINLLLMTMLSLVYEITYVSVKRQRDREHQKFLQLAATDPLTGLANRHMFDETLAARIELYSKLTPIRRFALCYLDLDKFKPINDQFGHNIGDEVLNTISERLKLALRGADFVGRHGGDEFLMLLDSVHDTAAAEAVSKRFLQLIQEPIDTSVGAMQVGGSFGIALFPDHGDDAATLQKAADDAMYEAKRTRSGFQIFVNN